ncbi:hypothetical protein [Streptacidiphilus jiangxiensis]|uniref:Uncharacterized protein n=1 Tax=Streptacidiphilus jiangxiensis TaxID=235985 RepID=A0A1H7TRU0_STRJI|nr:hypothetical protein [Streptacidiphilus jiangxiensis]SEL87239.1 hypothetical protein SAMN05414137_114156 [Streptacidiphilus jiangxiensis]
MAGPRLTDDDVRAAIRNSENRRLVELTEEMRDRQQWIYTIEAIDFITRGLNDALEAKEREQGADAESGS